MGLRTRIFYSEEEWNAFNDDRVNNPFVGWVPLDSMPVSYPALMLFNTDYDNGNNPYFLNILHCIYRDEDSPLDWDIVKMLRNTVL
jgi:hypothetical protein